MSDALNKLAALKAAFDKKSSGGGDQSWKLFYPFWKMPDDATAIVRFLPDLDPDNSLQFLVENLQHELVVNGQRKKVPCLQMYGEECPVCALSRQYYDAEGDGSVNGKKYYRKKSYIGQVIVVESPIEHDQSQLVKLIEFGPQVFKQIQAAFQSGDLEEAPFEFKGGYNFRFRKTKTGSGQNSYTTSSFAPKQTDLEDDVIASLTLYNLADYRGKKPDLSTVEALLVADQTGQQFAGESADEAAPPAPAPVAAKVSAPAPVSEPVSEPVQTSTPAAQTESSPKTTSVIDALRARQAAKAAAGTPA